MTDVTVTAPTRGARGVIAALNGLAARWIPLDAAQIAARLAVGLVFWQSARTKVDGFAISDSTYFLFENVYNLPIIPSAFAAVMATIAEHVLSVLLILGLMGRFAAAGLLVMTLVIQLFVFPEAYVTHGLWAASLLLILARGPGWVSLDRALGLER